MADYTSAEILNEASKVFRARIDPGKEGGTLNTRVEYGQLLENASLTFLLNNDAIFYVAKLVKNRLLNFINQEIKLVEDTLIALDDLTQIGQPIRDTTALSNARTALLALNAAQTVQDRPEAQRFGIQMDRFANLHRKNVISARTRGLVRPKEDAQKIIRTNLTRMKKVHAKLLDTLFALQVLLDEYLALDIPSKAANTALTNIRNNLDSLEEAVEESSDAANVAQSRANVLTSMTSKAAVEKIASFSDPRAVKIRTPVSPIPSNLKHRGRVTGKGIAPSVLSGPGPWTVPLFIGLSMKINGGPVVTVSVNEVFGDADRAAAVEPFNFDVVERINLHALVDPRSLSATVSVGTTTSAILTTFLGLTYKNLGAPITFSEMSPLLANDVAPRAIQELRTLQTGTISSVLALGAEKYGIFFSGWSADDEAAVGLGQQHIGGYFKSGSDRWEILAVTDANTAIISVPDVLPTAIIPPGSGTITLRGDISSLTTGVAFQPALSVVAAGAVKIGSAVKTAQLSLSPNNDVAGVIDDVKNEVGDYDGTLIDNIWRQQVLNQYVQVKEDPLRPGQLLLTPRGDDSYMAISGQFLKILSTVGFSIVGKSCHEALGLLLGQSVAGTTISVADLAEFIEVGAAGIVVTVEKEEVAAGTLATTLSSNVLTAPELLGVVIVGDEVVLPEGTFLVTVASPITMDTTFLRNEIDIPYQVTRTRFRISTMKVDRGSSLEITSAPPSLGIPIGLVKGSIDTFEAVDKSGNKLFFEGVVPGDTLDIAGLPEADISAVDDFVLTLSLGLPSDVENKSFEVRSTASKQYESLVADITTFVTSRQLLKKNGFDEDLETLDNAITQALLPGQSFASTRNQASRIAAELLALLTSSPRRSSEYSTDVNPVSLDMETFLSTFSPPDVVAVDSLLDMFLERRYDRAVRLLQSGKVQEFFSTDEETGSFPGAMMKASRQVVNNMPTTASTAEQVDRQVNIASEFSEGVDAEYNLGDSELVSAGRRR